MFSLHRYWELTFWMTEQDRRSKINQPCLAFRPVSHLRSSTSVQLSGMGSWHPKCHRRRTVRKVLCSLCPPTSAIKMRLRSSTGWAVRYPWSWVIFEPIAHLCILVKWRPTWSTVEMGSLTASPFHSKIKSFHRWNVSPSIRELWDFLLCRSSYGHTDFLCACPAFASGPLRSVRASRNGV